MNKMQNLRENCNGHIPHWVKGEDGEQCLYCGRPRNPVNTAPIKTAEPRPPILRGLTSGEQYRNELGRIFGYSLRAVYLNKAQMFRVRIVKFDAHSVSFTYDLVGGEQEIPLPEGTEKFTPPIVSGLDPISINIVE